MSRHGVGDVASAVFADQYGCWGFLDLWRHRRHGPFDATDADLLATVSAPLARALRRCQARTFIEPATACRRDAEPVVLTLDDGPRITSRQMSLSEHTVQDHLKSIFAKTESRDRITLLSRALGTRLSGG
jgi:hypothetical protein